jgi:hypothetical protein
MQRYVLTLLPLLFGSPMAASQATQAPPEPMVSLGATGSRTGHLVETQREPDFSLLEIKTAPGNDRAFTELVLKGMCAALESRSASYVAAKRVPGYYPAFRVTFPANAKEADLASKIALVRTVSECRAVQSRTLERPGG